jgi:hypothetical protein
MTYMISILFRNGVYKIMLGYSQQYGGMWQNDEGVRNGNSFTFLGVKWFRPRIKGGLTVTNIPKSFGHNSLTDVYSIH